jgi:hypothetical protein
MLAMTNESVQPMATSSRILDAYVAGLIAEVERLAGVRDHSHDTLWLAQLDLQIKLKLQLIDDVSGCIGDEDGNVDASEVEYDWLSGISSALPSHT